MAFWDKQMAFWKGEQDYRGRSQQEVYDYQKDQANKYGSPELSERINELHPTWGKEEREKSEPEYRDGGGYKGVAQSDYYQDVPTSKSLLDLTGLEKQIGEKFQNFGIREGYKTPTFKNFSWNYNYDPFQSETDDPEERAQYMDQYYRGAYSDNPDIALWQQKQDIAHGKQMW